MTSSGDRTQSNRDRGMLIPMPYQILCNWYMAEKPRSQIWTEFSILSLYIVTQHSARHHSFFLWPLPKNC